MSWRTVMRWAAAASSCSTIRPATPLARYVPLCHLARADLDPEMVPDPLLASVGWSWLIDALDTHGATYDAPSGNGDVSLQRVLRRDGLCTAERGNRDTCLLDSLLEDGAGLNPQPAGLNYSVR